MPATAPPTNGRAALTTKIKSHEQKIDKLLGERAELRRKADERREAFAAEPELTTDSAAFRAADEAVKALGAKDDELSRARDEQTALLRLLSQEGGTTTKAFGLGD